MQSNDFWFEHIAHNFKTFIVQKHVWHEPFGPSAVLHLPLILQFCLYIRVGSPSGISLTFNPKSKTFTCTSTGGPATTVTWRRDGVVITPNATHQQTKTLVYPDNGTYQTLLTIAPSVRQQSLVGTYNCTVENVRGKSSKELVVTG